MTRKITKGRLMDVAPDFNVDPDQSYEALREAIDISTCRQCGDEYVYGWREKFCSDACEVKYIHEHGLEPKV